MHEDRRQVPSEVYTAEYFLSDACEGFDEFSDGTLSALKRQELEILGARPGMTVLDVGCGRGEVLRELRGSGVHGVGIDYAASAVALAHATLGAPAKVARADATALPFGDRTFDRILLGDVIEHIPWAIAADALREMRRVLRPDGELLVHTSPNRWFATFVMPLARIALRVGGQRELAERISTYEERKQVMHPNELSPLGLRRLVRNAGLRGKVWVSGDVLRSGAGPWTQELGGRRIVRLLARIAGAWPFRLLFGNDLFARVRP